MSRITVDRAAWSAQARDIARGGAGTRRANMAGMELAGWIRRVIAAASIAAIGLVATATAPLVAGCTCASDGAYGGADLRFTNAPPGVYRFEVDAWGEHLAAEVTFDGAACAPGQVTGSRLQLAPCATWDGGGLRLLVSDVDGTEGPADLQLTVSRDGVPIQTVHPVLAYRTYASCDRDVRHAQAVLSLPGLL